MIGLLCGCNAFGPVDTPTGDAQLLSAARAAFDRGDFAKAADYYSKVSSAASDSSNSESIFLVLAQHGATSAVFLNSILDGAEGGGKLITKIANALSSSKNTTEKDRLAILHAYQKTTLINSLQVKGLVQFVSALSMLGELFGEIASTQGNLKQSDLVSNPILCKASPPAGCGASSNDKMPTGTTSISSMLNATDNQFSGDANLYMVNAAIAALDEGIRNMRTTGSLGSSASSFSQTLISEGQILLIPNTSSPNYRALLIQQDIGA